MRACKRCDPNAAPGSRERSNWRLRPPALRRRVPDPVPRNAGGAIARGARRLHLSARPDSEHGGGTVELRPGGEGVDCRLCPEDLRDLTRGRALSPAARPRRRPAFTVAEQLGRDPVLGPLRQGAARSARAVLRGPVRARRPRGDRPAGLGQAARTVAARLVERTVSRSTTPSVRGHPPLSHRSGSWRMWTRRTCRCRERGRAPCSLSSLVADGEPDLGASGRRPRSACSIPARAPDRFHIAMRALSATPTPTSSGRRFAQRARAARAPQWRRGGGPAGGGVAALALLRGLSGSSVQPGQALACGR